MAKSTLRTLLPHYLVLVAIITVLVIAMRFVVPDATIWHHTALAIVVGLAYPMVLRYLGMAPEPWT